MTREEYIRDLHENPAHKDLTPAERHQRVCEFVETPSGTFANGGYIMTTPNIEDQNWWRTRFNEVINPGTIEQNYTLPENSWSWHAATNAADVSWSAPNVTASDIRTDMLWPYNS